MPLLLAQPLLPPQVKLLQQMLLAQPLLLLPPQVKLLLQMLLAQPRLLLLLPPLLVKLLLLKQVWALRLLQDPFACARHHHRLQQQQ